jgi:uncharacterized membrane protein
MGLLVIAALLWLGLHIGVSGTNLRDRVVGAIGERAFKGVFSLFALGFLALLFFAYVGAPTASLWATPPWLVAVVDAAMLAALLLLAGGLIPPRGTGEGPRGMFRITRHPLMNALGLWSGAHLLANGDTASLVFFGAFLLTVLVGVPSQDGKLARRDPAKAAALHRQTSRLPFVAILAGRNRLALAEIGWWPPIAALIGWLALLYLHPLVIGGPALPIW